MIENLRIQNVYVNLQETEVGIASVAVTPSILETWSVSVDQLHQDALAADMTRGAMLCDMGNMMESMMFGAEPDNLLMGNPDQERGMGMYCLTNGEKMNGAGLVLEEELMQQIGEIVGGDFYILPSNTHEVLVVPENMEIEVKELSAMVQQINQTEVSTEDGLSDHVQQYDRKEAVMENAEKRVSCLEKGRQEEHSRTPWREETAECYEESRESD